MGRDTRFIAAVVYKFSDCLINVDGLEHADMPCKARVVAIVATLFPEDDRPPVKSQKGSKRTI